MNSLRGNFTVNRLLCLLRTLPEINCDWLVHVGARKTYDLLSAELPLFSPDESLYFRRMKSTTRVITTTKKTLPTGKMTWATVWATTRERPSYHAIRDRGHAKDDGGTARETIAYGRSRRVQILTARLSTHCWSLYDHRIPKRVNSRSIEFKYRQLHWAPTVEAYMIAVPLNPSIHGKVQRIQETIYEATKLLSTIRSTYDRKPSSRAMPTCICIAETNS